MIETVNNHFKSMLNNLLIKAFKEQPTEIHKNSFNNNSILCFTGFIIKRINNNYDIVIITKHKFYVIPYMFKLTKEQIFLIDKLFEKYT